MDPDAGLIRRMNQGDDEAIEAFVRKYYPQILGYCCYHLRHRQDGEDVTQETFARFKKCTEIYCKLWQEGSTIDQLAVAV